MDRMLGCERLRGLLMRSCGKGNSYSDRWFLCQIIKVVTTVDDI